MGGKTSTTTSQVQIPPEVMANYNAVNAMAKEAAANPFQTYSSDPSKFVAQMNPTQLNAMGPLNIDQYKNPYINDVVNTTLSDYDVNAGKTRAAQAAQAAQGGAFRGSRYALREANTEGELARGRAAADANLRSSAFDKATSLSSQDADRRQSASIFNAGQENSTSQYNSDLALRLAQAQQAGATTQSQLLAALGAQQQAQDQAEINAPYTQALQGSALLQALNPSMFVGQTSDTNGTTTSKTSGGVGSVLGTLAMLAAAPLTGGTSLLGMGLGAAGLGGLAGAAGTAAGLGGAVSGLTRI